MIFRMLLFSQLFLRIKFCVRGYQQLTRNSIDQSHRETGLTSNSLPPLSSQSLHLLAALDSLAFWREVSA